MRRVPQRLLAGALVYAFVGALALSTAAPRPARAGTDEAALWVTAHLVIPLGERVSAHLAVQPRFDEDIEEFQRVVVRPWLQATLWRGLSGALGYDAHVIENPRSTLEQRAWQQLAWQRAGERGRLFGRVRLEERFFEGVDTTALRGRFLVGVGVALPRAFELEVRNEFLVNLNATRNVARTGYRENRFYAGIGRALGERLRWDLGYQMQSQDPRGRNRVLHTVMLGLRFDAPSL